MQQGMQGSKIASRIIGTSQKAVSAAPGFFLQGQSAMRAARRKHIAFPDKLLQGTQTGSFKAHQHFPPSIQVQDFTSSRPGQSMQIARACSVDNQHPAFYARLGTGLQECIDSLGSELACKTHPACRDRIRSLLSRVAKFHFQALGVTFPSTDLYAQSLEIQLSQKLAGAPIHTGQHLAA